MRIDELERLIATPAAWTCVYTDGPQGEPPGSVESRMRSLKDRLLQAGAPEADADAVTAALSSGEDVSAPSARWLLVRDGEVVVDEAFDAARLGQECVVHGGYPEIVPLLRHLSAERRILVVETERDGARLTVERVGRAGPETTQEVEGENEMITKVQAGGWSHSRYQRHAEDHWQHNQSEVAYAVNRLVRERRPEHVFVSGDVRARQLLLERLDGASRELVVEVDADTRAAGSDDTRLRDAIDDTLAGARRGEVAQARERAAVADAREGATGVADVVAALQQAQVDTLVLDPRMSDGDATLLALDAEPWVAVAEADAFDATGTPLPVLEALARAAVLTGARVVFDEEDLDEAEARSDNRAAAPWAALRWPADQTAPGSPA
ncbi:baeRF2 domain-containing protein [Microbacterium sp.]|uniref:baeRF2 domain-containing protein n=1 Tax=Microbacterium sp. TaxID=51671 RepID=UPI002811DAA2|nr:Vms1/Ankzf1 family peptidyl-tRNA hydrolase [Microbacterium sp.]